MVRSFDVLHYLALELGCLPAQVPLQPFLCLPWRGACVDRWHFPERPPPAPYLHLESVPPVGHDPIPGRSEPRGRANRRCPVRFRLVWFHAVPFLVVGAGSSPRSFGALTPCFSSLHRHTSPLHSFSVQCSGFSALQRSVSAHSSSSCGPLLFQSCSTNCRMRRRSVHHIGCNTKPRTSAWSRRGLAFLFIS